MITASPQPQAASKTKDQDYSLRRGNTLVSGFFLVILHFDFLPFARYGLVV
jgi:hypothetical protein